MINISYFSSAKQNNKILNAGVERYIEKILDNQYYTESGPLLLDFERRIGNLIGVSHVIAISNPSVAWLLLLEAEGLRDHEVFVTKNINLNVVNAARWLGCKLKILNLKLNYVVSEGGDEHTPLEEITHFRALLTNKFGGLEDLYNAVNNKYIHPDRALFDSSESFMCSYLGVPAGSHGKAEVFSFDNRNIVNGEFAAAITTNCDNLADYLRCMRGSGGIVNRIKTVRTANGRMSEGQAAFALAYLDHLDELILKNKEIYEIYHEAVSNVDDIKIVSTQYASLSNFQNFVFTTENECMERHLIENASFAGFKVETFVREDFNKSISSNNQFFVLPTDTTAELAEQLIKKIFETSAKI